MSALQTFPKTIIRVARLSTLNGFISSRRATTSKNGRPLSPTSTREPARVLAREQLPGEIGVARQIGGRHLGNVTSSKCSLLQFGSSRPSSSGRNRLANRHQQEGPSPARVMPPRAKNSRNSNVAAPDEPRRRAGRGRASRRRTTDCASRAGSSYRSDPSGAQGDGGIIMYEIRSRFLCRAVVSVSARPIDFRAASGAAESKRRASGS